MPTLANPHVLWLLLLLPLWAVWFYSGKDRRAVLRFSVARVLAAGGRGWRARFVPLLPWLRMGALALTVVALARPQTPDARGKDRSVEGIDIMISFDLSSSMEAGDFRPKNRLHVAKEVLGEFIASRTNDRIGLVVFAGAAYTQAPLTLDYGVLRTVVKQLRTRVVEDGTAIGDALAMALNRLDGSDAKSRVVVLITDGDNNAGKLSPIDAAKMARALGIPIYTILVGRGGKVPFPAGQDLFGNTAWRELEIPINPELLKDISAKTGGEFYQATDRATLAQGLQQVLNSLERSKLVEGAVSGNLKEEFRPYLALGLALAALELLLRRTVLRVLP